MNNKLHILMTERAGEFREAIVNAAPGCEFRFTEDRDSAQKEDALWADIILGQVKPEWLAECSRLKWLQTGSAGVEHFLKPGTLPQSVILTNSTGAYGLAIAECMLGMLLSIQKKLALYRDEQNRHKWKPLGSVTSIYGSTVLVLGMGDIGGEFAMRCKAMGAHVIGVRRQNADKPEYADELYLTEELDKLLPRADVVAVTMPGTKETRGMISRQRIQAMKDGAILLNVGRGYIVDTDALCDALESGKLMGAGLDVTDPEPLPENHPLWAMPDAVITPHVSGNYSLEETYNRIMKIFIENLGRYYRGEELMNIVDREAGYKGS